MEAFCVQNEAIQSGGSGQSRAGQAEQTKNNLSSLTRRLPRCAAGSRSDLSAWTRLAKVTLPTVCVPLFPAKRRTGRAKNCSGYTGKIGRICWWTFRQNCRLVRALVMSGGPRFSISSRWLRRSIISPSISCWSMTRLRKNGGGYRPNMPSCLQKKLACSFYRKARDEMKELGQGKY